MCKLKIVVISFVYFFLVLPLNAQACGESLFRVGKGVNYREYTAPLPGNIIIVANTEGELIMAERIAAAGHHVKVVSQPSEIGESLNVEDFDVVLALYNQREVVEPEITSYSVTYLPVAMENTAEQEQARSAYHLSLSTDDSVKNFLKTIHKALKERQT